MNKPLDDVIDTIPCTDGTRYRVMMVWEPSTDRISLRIPKNAAIVTLGIIERAKMILTEQHIVNMLKQAQGEDGEEGNSDELDQKFVLFPGGVPGSQ